MKGTIVLLLAIVLVARFLNKLTLVLVRMQTLSAKLVISIIHISAICYIANSPKITTHPRALKEVVPGKPVTFTVRAIGTKPLRYQWQWKPGEEGSSSQEWQECDTETFADASNPKLVISSVQKSKEGSYRCVVSNGAGIQTSRAANLCVGKINFWAEVKSFHLCFLFLTFYM